MVLNDIKTLQNMDLIDTSKDGVINIYINKSKVLIKNYLHCEDTVDIEATYPDAIIENVIICLNRKGCENIKQFSQGSHSGTYGNDLSDSVKFLLPLPNVKMR